MIGSLGSSPLRARRAQQLRPRGFTSFFCFPIDDSTEHDVSMPHDRKQIDRFLFTSYSRRLAHYAGSVRVFYF